LRRRAGIGSMRGAYMMDRVWPWRSLRVRHGRSLADQNIGCHPREREREGVAAAPSCVSGPRVVVLTWRWQRRGLELSCQVGEKRKRGCPKLGTKSCPRVCIGQAHVSQGDSDKLCTAAVCAVREQERSDA
jgi:hypothetical protein